MMMIPPAASDKKKRKQQIGNNSLAIFRSMNSDFILGRHNLILNRQFIGSMSLIHLTVKRENPRGKNMPISLT